VSIHSSVVSQASCRVDLAGGTLDIWPLYLFHEKAVTVNFAVDVMTRCEIRRHPGSEIVLVSSDTGRTDRFATLAELHAAKSFQHSLAVHLIRHFLPVTHSFANEGFTLTTNSHSPAGAGISGSSALMIASTAALAEYTGEPLDREQIRVIAQNVEAQLIRVPTGCQDYYPALYGGVNAIHLRASGIEREALPVDPEEIERRFLVAYTGAPRQSGINNWEVFKAHLDGNQRVHRNFDDIAAIANGMRSALIASDWQSVTKLLQQEWKLRRSNAPGITTPLIDTLISETANHGALAAKVCGAGGGGCVTFQIEPGAERAVGRVIEGHGAQVLPFKVAQAGVTVTTNSVNAAVV
jgi:D-glycero-alpha-D-manno-heptose-7-phosphate kinase